MKTKTTQKVSGMVKRHPDGFGFFIPDDRSTPDAYIPKPDMRGIMTNDKVEVQIKSEPGGNRFRAKIIRVTKRAFDNVVGQVYILGDGTPILADSCHSWGADLKIECDETLEKGTWVAAQIKTFPDHPKGFTGSLVQVIGDGLNPSNDNIRIIFSHQIPSEFSKACLEEAKKLSPQTIKDELKNRKDLRSTPFLTIDGATAKDFDDAVFVEKSGAGFRCMVAIADVSFYVEQGGPIDQDADERGTSTYLPNFVNPMLPEELSNELCSLKPNVDRLAYVADMQFDGSGKLVKSDFYEAVIKSHARVTYGEAQEIIEGVEETPHEHVRDQILLAGDFAKILQKRRFKNGSLELEIPETQVNVDDAGEVVDIAQTQRLFAHKLIEEMMLAANVAVASFFIEKDIPSVYRIHEPPKPEMIDKLEVYLSSLGADARLQRPGQQKKMTNALREFEGKPEHKVLSLLTLRSMSQAKYALDNVGHFGLGFDNYTHFTSPIRRYPDLMVHRQLKAYSKSSKGYQKLDEEKIASKATWFSACEQRSVKAERQLISIKKARFMKKFLGEEFTGYISGVAKFGVFVSLREYDIDGLVKIEELPNDYFKFEEEFMKLVGERSGVEFKVGDELKIQVAAVNEEEGQIDFKPIFDQEYLAEVNKLAKKPKKEKWTKDKKRKAALERGNKNSSGGSESKGKKSGSKKKRSGKKSSKSGSKKKSSGSRSSRKNSKKR